MENKAMGIMENVTDVVTEDTCTMEPIDCQSKGAAVAGAVVKGMFIVGGIAAAIAIKNKAKITRWMDEQRIKKLQKKGYSVHGPEDYEYDHEYYDEEVTEETEK